jgi:fibronectin type 3 domain-containing protein
VTNVEFYVDGTLVGSSTASPYSSTWSATIGSHVLTAVAKDNAGQSTTSSVVNVTVVLNYNAYEPFNYSTITNGSPSTASGFSGTWNCGVAPSIVAGMTYTGLPVANSALSSTSGRQSVNFLGSLSSGTEYVSFLFTQVGNNGGNKCGVYFPNGGTGLYFGYGFAPGGTSGALGLGTMNTVGTGVQGTVATLGSSFTGTYGTTYLVVMKIDFNTSGANDTVTVYINPTANSPTPGVAATYTNSSFDVGTITGIGLNRGSTYGSVVGYNPPSTPTGLVANAGINSVGLSWTAVSGATSYNVLRGTSTGVYTVTNSAASNTNFDATAIGGTQYFYVVQASNSSGLSGLSSEVTASPMVALPNVTTGLVATGTNSAVRLSWNVAVGATGYIVKRSTTSGAEVGITSVGTTGYLDTAVVNGQQYFYKVTSTNSTGVSADSSEVNATPNLPPSAPTGLSVVAGTNQAALTWTGSAGAITYSIKRSLTSGSGYSVIGSTASPTTAYTDSTAVKFTQYYYVVSASNANGESSDSSEVNTTPLGVYAPVAYESFNYPSGTLSNGVASTAVGFSGNWNVSGGASITAGLTYTGLAVSNNALNSSSATHQYESLATAQSSASVWVSVLFQQAGDNGGNRDGFVMADASGNGVEFAYQQYGGIQGLPAIMSINGFFNYAGQLSPFSSTPQTYGAANLYVFQLNYGGGSLTNIVVYSNPAIGTNVPPTPDFTVSSGLSGIGALSVLGVAHQAGVSITVDEVKVGQVFGDVVGYVPSTVNTSPTNIVTSLSGNQLTLSWPADHTGWTLQSQTNSLSTGVTAVWYDVPGSTSTNQVTFTIDPANPAVFYHLKYTP